MSNIIGIINYGIAGNIYSVNKAVEIAGGDSLIVNDISDLKKVDKIIIPGVGSFKNAMNELRKKNLIDHLRKFDNPILGICLGMQVLAKLGFEFGKTKGLEMIDAEVKPILCEAKVPHMGFNNIEVVNPNKLLKGVEFDEFYFMHSYEVINFTDVSALTSYGKHTFVSALQKDNIYGVQFHPEKSREAGIKLLKNFIALKNN